MHEIVRVTSDDYRDYRKACSKIEYAYSKSGDEEPGLPKKVAEITQNLTKGLADFLNAVQDPNREIYFLKIDNEIQGISELIFSDKYCYIEEFSVFKQNQGFGSIFFEEILEKIKKRNCRKIFLWCPFGGAQNFWLKKGFQQKEFFHFEKRVRYNK